MNLLNLDKKILLDARVRGPRSVLRAPGVVPVRVRLPFTAMARRVWIDVSRLPAP